MAFWRGGRWGRGGGGTNGLSMTQPMVWSCWIHSEWLSGGEGGDGRGDGRGDVVC